MRLHYLLILAITCIAFGTACKKENSKQATSRSTLPSSFSIPVTHQQAAIINELLAQGKIKGPVDFRAKVDSIKAATIKTGTGKVIANGVTTVDDYNEGAEDEDMAAYLVSDQSTLGDWDIVTGNINVYGRFSQDQVFAIRGNQIKVIVPYQYTWGTFSSTTGTNTITNVRASTPIQLLPVGADWGVVTQGLTNYINPGISTNPWNQSAGITAYATAQEVRTEIFSTTSKIKISTSSSVEFFTVGSELEEGFIIQSAVNIYNQYTMDAYGEIWIEAITPGYNAPLTEFIGTIHCRDYGILQNE
jgi:hypothetical protein